MWHILSTKFMSKRRGSNTLTHNYGGGGVLKNNTDWHKGGGVQNVLKNKYVLFECPLRACLILTFLSPIVLMWWKKEVLWTTFHQCVGRWPALVRSWVFKKTSLHFYCQLKKLMTFSWMKVYLITRNWKWVTSNMT